ncbi:dehydratase [Halobacteriales archaeon Cl-PHB]
MVGLAAGETFSYERTFTTEDVERFADVTGDDQARHTEDDEDGRRLVQGLLTGSMLTKIGGDHEVLATRVDLHFRKPVYTGELIHCRWTTTHVEDHPRGAELTAEVAFERNGATVLEATVEGIIEE